MANLIVRKEDGSLLFDTDKIAYGLVKSGYLSYIESWSRYVCTSSACKKDPSWGGNWSASGPADAMYGFTVVGAKSPIVFITGGGALAGTKVVGDSMTFYYGGASLDSKFYCFDLMRDGGAGPALRTYKTDGTLTFNSRQAPLNVIANISPPGKGGGANSNIPGWSVTAYAGGYNSVQGNIIKSSVTIPIPGEGEVAAFLPWSRAVTCAARVIVNMPYQCALTEGCAGLVGGVKFEFIISAETTWGQLLNSSIPSESPLFRDIPDIRPSALVIRTSGLPFPFSIG